jgi:hypothetical protein
MAHRLSTSSDVTESLIQQDFGGGGLCKFPEFLIKISDLNF